MQWIRNEVHQILMIKQFDFANRLIEVRKTPAIERIFQIPRFRFLKTRLKVTEFKVGATSEAFEFQALNFRHWILPDQCSWLHRVSNGQRLANRSTNCIDSDRLDEFRPIYCAWSRTYPMAAIENIPKFSHFKSVILENPTKSDFMHFDSLEAVWRFSVARRLSFAHVKTQFAWLRNRLHIDLLGDLSCNPAKLSPLIETNFVLTLAKVNWQTVFTGVFSS